jgi:F-type H+-transporting ATPase subunit delta
MRDSVVARRYARAVYKLSHAQGKIADVMAELGVFAAVFREREDLRKVLAHPAISPQDKIRLIQEIVETDITRDFLKFLIQKGRLTLLPVIYEDLLKVYRRDAGIVAVEVTSAVPLAEDLKERLITVLRRLTGKRVEVGTVVDENVIGGLKFAIGDYVVDATLATRLEDIRETIAGAVPDTNVGPAETFYENKAGRDKRDT